MSGTGGGGGSRSGDASSAYEHAPVGLLLTDADARVLRVNHTFLDWTGYRPSEVVGQTFEALLTAGGRLFAETRYRPVLRLAGAVRELALDLRRVDGSALPVLVNASADEEGAVHIAVFDASRRRDYERELLEARRAAERSEVRVRALQEAAATFTDAGTRQAVAEALAEAAGRALDSAPTAVLLLDGRLLRVEGGSHPLGPVVQLDLEGPELRVLRDERPVAVGSREQLSAEFPELAGPLHAARIEALAMSPVRQDGKILGVLACFFGRRREFPPHSLDLQAALCHLAGQALTRIRLQETLREMAMQDALTTLPNRALLRGRLVEALADARTGGRPMAVIFVDLDGFKDINDRLGHTVGDRVLTEVARRLTAVVRRTDTVGRFGGDEFMIVCRDADAATATRIAERVSEGLRGPVAGLPDDIRISASIGVAVEWPPAEGPLSVDDLIRTADGAMYAAKRDGKNRIRVVEAGAAEG